MIGAIGIAAANKVLMLEHSVYSVIPPEGCAAILWRQPSEGAKAAAALRLTAQSALELGLIDEFLPEPFGGAHRDWNEVTETVRGAIATSLASMKGKSGTKLKSERYEKFRKMGSFFEERQP